MDICEKLGKVLGEFIADNPFQEDAIVALSVELAEEFDLNPNVLYDYIRDYRDML